MTVSDLCQHFRQRELVQDDNWRSYSTRKNYSFLLKRWIIPKWGKFELSEVRTVDVELMAPQFGTSKKHVRQNTEPDVAAL